MTTASPWGSPPQRTPPPFRPSRIAVVLLVVLPLLAYVGGSYFEQRALANPQTRLALALQALDGGYDRTAIELLEPLAAKGNAMAEFHLAVMYEHGWGTPKDAKKAVDLYTKAAEQSLVPAQARLGEIYLHGTLVLQDLAKAREWSLKAARAGSSEAQATLADIYERGLGVRADSIEAYAWNAVAAAHGNALAASQRDRILNALSPDDQGKAEARAKAIEASLKAPPAPSAKAGQLQANGA
jgi:TPR repeat protein